MTFEWDEGKARANLAKHGVSFQLACRVWDDPHYDVASQVENGEERWVAIGTVRASMILVVVHVYRGGDDEEVVRIISARKATSHERRRDEQQAL
jgi:hypothetical protein